MVIGISRQGGPRLVVAAQTTPEKSRRGARACPFQFSERGYPIHVSDNLIHSVQNSLGKHNLARGGVRGDLFWILRAADNGGHFGTIAEPAERELGQAQSLAFGDQLERIGGGEVSLEFLVPTASDSRSGRLRL